MQIGDKIRKLREAKGLSQPQLAERAGVSQQLISNLESGKVKSSKKLPEIAAALGAAPSQIDSRYSEAGAPAAREPAGSAFNEEVVRIDDVRDVLSELLDTVYSDDTVRTEVLDALLKAVQGRLSLPTGVPRGAALRTTVHRIIHEPFER